MSKPIVASVQRFEEAAADGQSAANLLAVGGARTRVILDGSSFLIDREHPRYRAWTELLLLRERSGKPVYAEIEPAGEAGERITRLEVPRLRQVAEIFPIQERQVFGVRLAGSPLVLLPSLRPRRGSGGSEVRPRPSPRGADHLRPGDRRGPRRPPFRRP